MFEALLGHEPREARAPFHQSVTNAIEYVEAVAADGDTFEVWQVADDETRTRVLLMVSGELRGDVAHYHEPAHVTRCACESSLCDHGDASCSREGSTPAPVQYLYGELMCSHCIGHYIAEGYGVNPDGSPMPKDAVHA